MFRISNRSCYWHNIACSQTIYLLSFISSKKTGKVADQQIVPQPPRMWKDTDRVSSSNKFLVAMTQW